MANEDYIFLEIKTPKEALGNSLDNKMNHALYQAILANTTQSGANLRGLFNTSMDVPGVRVHAESDLDSPLKRLLDDELIQMLIYITYDEYDKSLDILPCFIGIPQDRYENLTSIYIKTIDQSVKSIESFISSLPFNEEDYYHELEANLNQPKPLTAAEYRLSVIEPFAKANKWDKEIKIPANVLETTREELARELSAKKITARFEDDKYFYLDKNLTKRIDLAGKLIKEKIAPLYQDSLGSELATIARAEDKYLEKPFAKPTSDFHFQRADLINKHLLAQGKSNYPGRLALLTVIFLHEYASEQYNNDWERIINDEFRDMKTLITAPGEEWSDIVFYFPEDRVKHINPVVWDKIMSDKDLASTEWQLKNDTSYAVIHKKTTSFRKSIRSMAVSPPPEKWKILAFKQLLEITEPDLPDIFQEGELIKIYGHLLRVAYMNYFPWYYPLLIHFSFFRDLFFRNAKLKINAEQEYLGQQNSGRQTAHKAASVKKEQASSANERTTEIKNKLNSILDKIYFTEKMIPTVKEIISQSGFPEAEVNNCIKAARFQVFRLRKEDTQEDSILIYPIDHEWRGRSAKLKNILHEQVEAFKHGGKEKSKEAFPYNRLYSHLSKKQGASTSAAEKKEDTDPYEAFEHEINKTKG